MSPGSVDWRPRGLAEAAPSRLDAWFDAWERAPLAARWLGLVGAFIALALLCGFYIVVAGAVHRAEAAREQARLDVDRQAICGAHAAASSRELCAVTVATRLPAGELVPAKYDERAWKSGRRPQLTAGVSGAPRQLR